VAEARGPLMSPGFWLHHAALAWRQLFDRRLRPLEATPTQFMLLAAVSWLTAASGRPPTQQEAADHAGADRMMTSKVVQALAGRGLLVREPDPGDARVRRLRLTEAGRALVRAGIRIATEVDAELFGPSSEALRAELQQIASRTRAAGP
jgi:DNA-binding MarR family transcriptional regulator